MCYSAQPKDRIFVKGYEFLFLAKNIGKNNGKNKIKTYGVNTVKNVLIMLKKSATIELKTASEEGVQKRTGATGDWIGNKIANKIAKMSVDSPQNNLETVTNEA